MIDFKVLCYTMLFVLLIAILHTLNQILKEIRDFKKYYKGNYDFTEKKFHR